MARTVDLTKPRDTFTRVLQNAQGAWSSSASVPLARRKTIAEDIVLRSVVGWETFISDWFIGATSHDTTKMRQALERKLNTWLEQEVQRSSYSRWPIKLPSAKVDLLRQPRVGVVRELLDRHGRNLEFADTQELVTRGSVELASKYATRTQTLMSSGVHEVIDAALAIRNVLAHRSPSSVERLNGQIGDFPTYPLLRRATVSSEGVGTYLNATINQAGDARIVVYLRELKRVAHVLVP